MFRVVASLAQRLFWAVVSFTIAWRRGFVHPGHVQQRIHRCRSVIDFSFSDEVRGEVRGDDKIRVRLALRAKANKNLVDALGIRNSLTTTDLAIHRAFVAKATKLLGAPGQWQRLYSTAEALLEHDVITMCAAHTASSDEHSFLFLAPLVRSLCFRVVMQILFQAQDLDSKDVATACEQINVQWVRSKQCGNRETLKQSPVLNEVLARLLQKGQLPGIPPQEALELILPAYETLWRVILLTFVTACHRTTGESHPLLHADVRDCLGKRDTPEKEALNIAKEGLRLFPSSKRIYRAQSLASEDTIAADVQALHRDHDIWGSDANEFRPERFDDAKWTPLQREAYVPFGLRPHRCPAFSGFGERMVVLLVVVLRVRLGPEKAAISFNNPRLDGCLKEQLPTDRNDMEAWVLTIKN